MFYPIFVGVPSVELVLELHKYDLWRNVLMHDILRLIHFWFIFRTIIGTRKQGEKSTKGPQLSSNSIAARGKDINKMWSIEWSGHL